MSDQREYLIDMVENKYFANVDAKRLQPALDCFVPDAEFTIQSAFSKHVGTLANPWAAFKGTLDTFLKDLE